MFRLLVDENFDHDIVRGLHLQFADELDERVLNAEPMPGVFIVPQSLPIGTAIEELILILSCSQQSEWENIIQFIPV